MKKLYFLIFLVIFMLIVGFSFFQQRDFSKIIIKTEKVAGSVYMLQGSGGNIGVSFGEDGVVMIDDQFAPLSDKIKAAIQELGGSHPRFILNTHHHGDHVGGNANFSKEGTLIAHTNVRNRLMDESKEAWPVITFDESLAIHMNGEEIRAIHYPNGHTDGDAVIYFTGSNVVHMGDHFFVGRFPYIDLDGGGDVAGFVRNVEKIMQDLPPDIKIIPGHGSLATLDDLKTFHNMLLETTGYIRAQIGAGKSSDDIKSAGLPEKWNSWGT
ncbi:MAG: MBL fold metallo-hydrolase, partial [bacterium]